LERLGKVQGPFSKMPSPPVVWAASAWLVGHAAAYAWATHVARWAGLLGARLGRQSG